VVARQVPDQVGRLFDQLGIDLLATDAALGNRQRRVGKSDPR
jgi:hypothetical protein